MERAREVLKDNPDLIARLERIGHERALTYKTLVLTGLRKGELASLTVGQVEFDGPVAYAILNAADEKNRQGSSIPLRADLVAELSTWLAERLRELRETAGMSGQPIPARLPASTPLFQIASGLARILDRDLAAAGIPKRDERNRVFDVHALRVTFGTHLCRGRSASDGPGRHATLKPELTANIYTDPKLLDVAGAINALPALMSPDRGLRDRCRRRLTKTPNPPPGDIPSHAPKHREPRVTWSRGAVCLRPRCSPSPPGLPFTLH